MDFEQFADFTRGEEFLMENIEQSQQIESQIDKN